MELRSDRMKTFFKAFLACVLLLITTAFMTLEKITCVWTMRLLHHPDVSVTGGFVILGAFLIHPLVFELLHILWNVSFLAKTPTPCLPTFKGLLLGILTSCTEGACITIFAIEVAPILPVYVLMPLLNSVFCMPIMFADGVWGRREMYHLTKFNEGKPVMKTKETLICPRILARVIVLVSLATPCTVAGVLYFTGSVSIFTALALVGSLLCLSISWIPEIQLKTLSSSTGIGFRPRKVHILYALIKMFTICTCLSVYLYLYTLDILTHMLDELYASLEYFTYKEVFVPLVLNTLGGIFSLIFGYAALGLCLPLIGVVLPSVLSTLGSIALCVTLFSWSVYQIDEFNDMGEISVLLVCAVVASIGWCAPYFIKCAEFVRKPDFLQIPYEVMFLRYGWTNIFFDQRLLLSYRSDGFGRIAATKVHSPPRCSRIFICTTMYRESDYEMERLLLSLLKLSRSKILDDTIHLESHIFMDNGCDGIELKEFSQQLIELVIDKLHVDVTQVICFLTPYGLQLRWKLNGVMPMFIHMKDSKKVKTKKRWSQAMYMMYMMNYRSLLESSKHAGLFHVMPEYQSIIRGIWTTGSSRKVRLVAYNNPTFHSPSSWVGDSKLRGSCATETKCDSSEDQGVGSADSDIISRTSDSIYCTVDSEDETVIPKSSSHTTDSSNGIQSTPDETTDDNSDVLRRKTCSAREDKVEYYNNGFVTDGTSSIKTSSEESSPKGTVRDSGLDVSSFRQSRDSELLLTATSKDLLAACNRIDKYLQEENGRKDVSIDDRTCVWKALKNSEKDPWKTWENQGQAAPNPVFDEIKERANIPNPWCDHVTKYKPDMEQDKISDIFDDDQTYILATDADMEFKDNAVKELLNLCNWDKRLGAACGRTHPIGKKTGPIVWHQIFEYAKDFWMIKNAQNVIGSVMCCPGCFSLYRATAIKEVMQQYSRPTHSPFTVYVKDTGEDRWIATLMMIHGWRLRYNPYAHNTTYCPDTFEEFLKQRRRWVLSDIANAILVARNVATLMRNNVSFTVTYVLYLAQMFLNNVITPGSAVVMITAGLDLVFNIPYIYTTSIMSAIVIFYTIICTRTAVNTQILVTMILTLLMGTLFFAVVVWGSASILNGIVDDIINNQLRFQQHYVIIMLTASLAYAAAWHPSEFGKVLYGLAYVFIFPAMHIFLPIYAISNIVDQSWGTRDANVAKKPKISCFFRCKNRKKKKKVPERDGSTSDAFVTDVKVMADGDTEEKRESAFWENLCANLVGTNVNMGLGKAELEQRLLTMRNRCVIGLIVINILWIAMLSVFYLGFMTSLSKLNLYGVIAGALYGFTLIVQIIGLTASRIDFLYRRLACYLYGDDKPMWVHEREVQK